LRALKRPMPKAETRLKVAKADVFTCRSQNIIPLPKILHTKGQSTKTVSRIIAETVTAVTDFIIKPYEQRVLAMQNAENACPTGS
jgi:hypothetical protein